MTSPPSVAVGLRAGHYAFMRAVVQGLDWRESWQRYLAQDDVPVDAQAVRAEIERIRWAFAAAARRARKPGLARLVLLDAEYLPDGATPLPSLEDFALQAGLEDFSYQEQAAAYEARYGAPTPARRGAARRARIVSRQLEALTWLEAQSTPLPIDGDPIASWLAPGLCDTLTSVGIASMGDLKAWIAQRGVRWIQPLRTLGPVKGARLLAWLREQGIEPMGLHRPGTPVRRRGAGEAKASAAGFGTGIHPLELYAPPPALDAARDIDLIVDWVASAVKVTGCGSKEEIPRPTSAQDLASRRLSSTQKCYRREAERLLLWAHLVRGCRLSELSRAACVAYLDFLQDPMPRFQWCGPRGGQRWSATWRPFEGPLSAAARQQSRVILRGLFRFLLARQVGVDGSSTGLNPWDGVAVLGARRNKDSGETTRKARVAPAASRSKRQPLQMDLRSDRARIGWLCRREFGLRLRDIVQLTWNDLDRLIGSQPSSEATMAQDAAVVVRYRLALVDRLPTNSVSPASPVFAKLPQVVTSKPPLTAARQGDSADSRSPVPAGSLGLAISPSALCQDMRRMERLGALQRLSD